MQAVQFKLQGAWGHFRKVETNNNPLTHDFVTKTALMGLFGAVLGIERKVMRPLFPQFCEDFRYGVVVENVVNKQSWNFMCRNKFGKVVQTMYQLEMLRNPSFTVLLALSNDRSQSYFEQFVEHLQQGQTHYPPVLGLHNCPAELVFQADGELSEPKEGSFETYGFVQRVKTIGDLAEIGRIGFERIPTFQNDDFWNLPDRYTNVQFASGGRKVNGEGVYYEWLKDKNYTQWYLI